MDDKELLTWIHLQSLIKSKTVSWIWELPWGLLSLLTTSFLGSEILTERKSIRKYWSYINSLHRWKIVRSLFNSLWTQEYTRRRLTVTWKEQGLVPQVGGMVLFRNKPIYRHEISAARIQTLFKRKNSDIYCATIKYRREVGGPTISSRDISVICTRSWEWKSWTSGADLRSCQGRSRWNLFPDARIQLQEAQGEFTD